MDGQGRVEFVDSKITYEGSFREDQITGRGRMDHLESGAVFEGDFVQGRKHGYGTFKLKGGQIYRGIYLNGVTDSDQDNFGPRF